MSIRKRILLRTIDISQYLHNFRGNKGNLTLRQLRTLIYIKENNTVKASAIAKEFHVTPATITAQIDRMVKTGWIERIHSPRDRRVIDITLTKKTEKELDSILESNLQNLEWIFETLNEKEEQCLLKIVDKIHAHRKKINP